MNKYKIEVSLECYRTFTNIFAKNEDEAFDKAIELAKESADCCCVLEEIEEIKMEVENEY